MKQRTLAAESGFERYTKKTGLAEFLEEMEQVVPWAELCALIEPVYPKAGQGRPPVWVERMLRLYFLQQWFSLSDPGVEEALYESVGCRSTYKSGDCGLVRERSWMRRLCMLRVRLRMRGRSAIRRCARRGRGSSGTSE